MKKSCGVFIAVYLVLFAGYYFFLQTRFEGGALWALSLLGSMGLALFLSGIIGLFTGSSDKTLLLNAGKKPPKDGKTTGVAGTVQPVGVSMCKSPLTGEDCLIYEYQFQTTDTGGNPIEYSGYGMTSCAIRTSLGDVRVLSFPILDAIPWSGDVQDMEEPDEPDSENKPVFINPAAIDPRAVAQEYIANTKFQEVGIGKIVQIFQEIWTDDDGILKVDLVRKMNSQQYNGDRFVQRMIPPGKQVCAIGHFSGQRGGLIGTTGIRPVVTRLFGGTAAEVSSRVAKEHRVTFTFGLVFFLFMHVFLFVVYKYRYTNGTPDQISSNLQIAIQDHNLKEIERMLDGGVDVNMQDSEGRTALLINYRDPDVVGLLLKHHPNLEIHDREWDETVLFKAAREGDAEVVRMLIKAGADVNAVSKIPSRRTPLSDAITAGRPDVEKMLLDAGAVDDRVTAANGTPISVGDDVASTFDAYMDAIYSKDVDAMMKLNGSTDRKGYESGDYNLWQSVRVRHPDSYTGFKNDTTATLRVEGPMPNGQKNAWWYQMKKSAEGKWFIEREWEEIQSSL